MGEDGGSASAISGIATGLLSYVAAKEKLKADERRSALELAMNQREQELLNLSEEQRNRTESLQMIGQAYDKGLLGRK